MASPTMIRRLPALAENVGVIRREVKACAGGHGVADPDAVALAVSEALSNAVVHAYVDAPEPGDVEVTVRRLRGNGVEVVVCDDGRGMIPRADSPGLGLGLPLVAMLSDHVDTQARPGGGTRVCMHFAVLS